MDLIIEIGEQNAILLNYFQCLVKWDKITATKENPHRIIINVLNNQSIKLLLQL